MIQIWVVIGLIISAISVSLLGATFSIIGLGKLFSGAMLAVWLMAGSLEFAKFVVAAYLHQAWHNTRLLLRVYMVVSVIVLSAITSLGIFGFLTDAYSSASAVFEAETIKLQKLEREQVAFESEIARLTRTVDEIPENRITKKIKARAEVEPLIRDLKIKITALEPEIASAKIKIIEVKQKVGPLIYIAKAFSLDIDTVVKYLILVFVTVFDPLAICLVIAISDALQKRRNGLGTTAPKAKDFASDGPSQSPSRLKMKFAEADPQTSNEQTSNVPKNVPGEAG